MKTRENEYKHRHEYLCNQQKILVEKLKTAPNCKDGIKLKKDIMEKMRVLKDDIQELEVEYMDTKGRV